MTDKEIAEMDDYGSLICAAARLTKRNNLYTESTQNGQISPMKWAVFEHETAFLTMQDRLFEYIRKPILECKTAYLTTPTSLSYSGKQKGIHHKTNYDKQKHGFCFVL